MSNRKVEGHNIKLLSRYNLVVAYRGAAHVKQVSSGLPQVEAGRTVVEELGDRLAPDVDSSRDTLSVREHQHTFLQG